MFTVNSGWFNSDAEAESKADEILSYWSNKLDNGEITFDEYCKKSPVGYEIFICTCRMRGLNMTYR